MSAKDQPQTDQKEYGDVQAAEETQAGLDASAAMEAANAPQVEMPVPEEQISRVQAPTPKSLMQLIPPSLLFGQNRRKPEPDRAYDVGTLWRVLAQAPDAPPFIKALAARLTGEERRGPR